MPEPTLTLDLVDADGAIREAREAAEPALTSRAEMLKTAVVGGGALMVGGVAIAGLPGLATAAPSRSQDVAILNFALTLEYLEAEFYTRAVRGGALSGELLRFARVVGGHERAHVSFLRAQLGSRAVARPRFDFRGTTDSPARFGPTAVALEDTGVAAYNGQGPNLTTAVLPAAASIVSVEARHAAWIRNILRRNPAPEAFETAQTRAQVQGVVNGTRFVVAS
jgi:hypothetical protein